MLNLILEILWMKQITVGPLIDKDAVNMYLDASS